MEKYYVIGIDGGGSNTRSIVVDLEGNVLGKGLSGPSSYSSISLNVIRENINDAITQSMNKANISKDQVAGLFLGLGGILSKKDKDTIIKEITKIDICNEKNIYAENDTRNSLAGGLGGKPGLSLIAGTGSVCYGKNEKGEDWKAGGWGHIIDDCGSGYDLGVQSIKSMVRALDGRGNYSPLVDKIFSLLELNELNDIITKLYQSDFKRKEIASLAPVVIEYAKQKDELALKILNNAVNELVLMIYKVANKLYLIDKEIQITMTGGITNSGELFNNMIKEAIKNKLPKAKIVKPMFSPLMGSAILGLEKVGVDINEYIINNLYKTN